MESITLTQFVPNYYYTRNGEGNYVKIKNPRRIRYRNYGMAMDLNEYRSEMITLHKPFRSEEDEFITIYEKNLKIFGTKGIIYHKLRYPKNDLNLSTTVP